MIKKRALLYIYLLMATLVVGFSSCENEPYIDPYDEVTHALCRNIWVDDYITDEDIDCEQQLIFFTNGKGKDIRTYSYRGDRMGTDETTFFWDWDNDYYDAVYIEYPNGDQTWLEEMRVGLRTLSCLYNGVPVTFGAL